MMKLDIQLFAVPARKVSKTRKSKRRSHNALTSPTTLTCSKCGAVIKPHRVCKNCGDYKGNSVIEVEESK